MANLLWGKVYFKDIFAGYLRQEPGGRYTFTYDDSYLNSENPAIAYTLPLQPEPHISEQNMPAFFDNLVAEGWLEEAQRRLLGKRLCSRFELLLAFGHDCAGAVTIIDPEPERLSTQKLDQKDPAELAIYRNRASLSGIQPKFLLTKRGRRFSVTEYGEISTHIAKLASHSLHDIVYNEWITLCACKALLPKDDFVEASLQPLEGFPDKTLIIKRFDRKADGSKTHFEEFNQLLDLQSQQKYEGAYQDMAKFILNEKSCLPSEAYCLYKRLLAGILMGNTDMHLKNFAMSHTESGLRLAPNYDLVAAAIYKPYQYIALRLDRAPDRPIGKLKAKNLIALGHEFFLDDDMIAMAVSEIEKSLSAAKDAIDSACEQHQSLKDKIMTMMEKRWNGTFSLIGRELSKQR